jgi:hypothetical protein
LYKTVVVLIAVAMAGAVAIPAMADSTTSTTNQYQAQEQQIMSDVQAGNLATAGVDLQSLQQTAGYAPSLPDGISDLTNALGYALENNNFVAANALLDEIQALTIQENSPSSTASNQYQDNSQQSVSQNVYQNDENDGWWSRQQNAYSPSQQPTNDAKSDLQQPRPQHAQSGKNNWWWLYLRNHHGAGHNW